MNAPRTLSCDEVRDLAPLFVLDALEPDDMAAVREHLATCADPHDELAALGEGAGAWLATVEPVEPPAGLKSRLLAVAAEDLASGRHPASVAPAAPVARPTAPLLAPTAPVPVSLDIARARRGRVGWLLAAAAVIAIVALGGWNLSLRSDLAAASAYRDGVNQALAMAARPGSLTALLAATDGSASGLGVVGADGTVLLAMRGLAPTSGSQVYTAWSIGGDGTPVAIGDFTVPADGVAVTTARGAATTPGVVLALTLEPRGGATKPSAPVVAKGIAAPPSS